MTTLADPIQTVRRLVVQTNEMATLADQLMTAISSFVVQRPKMTVTELRDYLFEKGIYDTALDRITKARNVAGGVSAILDGDA